MNLLFLDGRWQPASDAATREILSPHDGRVVAEVAEATAEDAVAAITAARRAFDTGAWCRTTAPERAHTIAAIGRLVADHREELAHLETLDTGKPVAESRVDMDDIAAVFAYFAGLAGSEAGRVIAAPRAEVASRVQREPVGVCTLITPWNYPLLQAAWKLAPALAAGNAVVLKPSELTPLTTHRLVELIDAHLDLPGGVLNLVLGAGPVVGEPLTTHSDVDLVSFTGGIATGSAIMAKAAATVKRVALELGGKNPNLVFADVDLDLAADHALTAAFLHAGQVCSAGSRLLVEASVHDTLVERIVDRLPEITLGDGFVDGVRSGPLISPEHRAKVERHIARAIDQGARLVAGGRRPDDPALAAGCYLEPPLFTHVDASMTIVREEVFGPVLTVESFADEAEAVDLANDTVYGLAGAVWTNDAGRAERVAGALRCGTVWINDFHPYFPQAEWGGFKRSGIGRELGIAGYDEYTELKHVHHTLRPAPSGWLPTG